jgi:hypothetical protein
MMVKKTHLCALLLGIASTMQAQTFSCGTKPPTPDEIRAYLSMKTQAIETRNANVTCIPIQAHIVRETNGTGGISLLALNQGLANLNFVYKKSCGPRF